jgi:hypothetical protein
VGVETQAFVANPEEITRFEGGPEPRHDVLKGLDTITLSTLGQLLFEGNMDSGPTYKELEKEMVDSMHTFSSGEEWAFRVPKRLTRAIAELPEERFPELADTWSRAEEFDWQTVDDVVEYLRDLRANAAAAQDSDKQLYLWMSL